MHALIERERISVDDYLAGESIGEIKHEYVGGDVYAMAGSSIEHNLWHKSTRVCPSLSFRLLPR